VARGASVPALATALESGPAIAARARGHDARHSLARLEGHGATQGSRSHSQPATPSGRSIGGVIGADRLAPHAVGPAHVVERWRPAEARPFGSVHGAAARAAYDEPDDSLNALAAVAGHRLAAQHDRRGGPADLTQPGEARKRDQLAAGAGEGVDGAVVAHVELGPLAGELGLRAVARVREPARVLQAGGEH
jgi:hypothetical protein